MPRKPARRSKPGVRALTLLVSRIGIRETAKRLRVPQKSVKRWQKSGVPKTKLDTLTLVKKRHENARKAAKKSASVRRVKALKSVTKEAGLTHAYNTGELDEIADKYDLTVSEVYTIVMSDWLNAAA